MKLIELVEHTALLLQLEDVLALPEFENSPFANKNPRISVSELTKDSLNLLKLCAHTAIRQVGQGYFNNYTLPNKLSYCLNDEIPDFDGKINKETLAMYAAGEYAAVIGLVNEAQMWQQKFENAMKLAKKSNGGIIKQRPWA